MGTLVLSELKLTGESAVELSQMGSVNALVSVMRRSDYLLRLYASKMMRNLSAFAAVATEIVAKHDVERIASGFDAENAEEIRLFVLETVLNIARSGEHLLAVARQGLIIKLG